MGGYGGCSGGGVVVVIALVLCEVAFVVVVKVGMVDVRGVVVVAMLFVVL